MTPARKPKTPAREPKTPARKTEAPNPFRQIIDSLSSGTVVLDRDGRIITANPAASAHLEVPPEALAEGCRFDEVAGVAPILEVIRGVSGEGGTVSRREIQLRSADGSAKVIGLTASPLQGDEAYNGVILLFVDLTEVRRLEHIARVNRQLAEIGELTAGVVHELRNPLSVISGLCELVRRRVDEDHPGRRHLDTILQETQALSQVITRFLSFARPFELDVTACDPLGVLQRAVKFTETTAAGRQVALTAKTGDKLPPLRADADKLAHALGNIIGNATELVPDDGTGAVTASVEFDGTMLRYRVEDNGPGIHLEPGDDLFSPFFSKRAGGTGLGLSIVQRVVSAHGGSVTYGNRDTGGAWFEVAVPLDPAPKV